ncbi:MAG: DUF997 family protein [Planctomycetota bacterium]|nr:DUF997 family protein [Planctomycetota bacterium]MDA1212575.1 DUF997 family protein [Planctomycetota bacterium]
MSQEVPRLPVGERQDDPVLVSSRREASIVLIVFLISLVWTVLASNYLGYDRKKEDLEYVFGFPDWIFWAIIVPWGSCIVFSFIFGAFFVRDEDLGQELEEQSDFL